MSSRRAAAAVLALVASVLAISPAGAAPTTAHRIAIQGVARDADDLLIPAGDIAIRIYSDSLGASPVYDSGAEFAGAIAQGIFDVVAGQGAPLTLDQEQSYFLELNAAGVEVIGDAAGGRWRFYPGGGSRARPDLAARLEALEAVVSPGPVAATALSPGARATRAAGAAEVASGFSAVHGMLGLGLGSGSGIGFAATGNLLAQPVGVRSNGGITVELGPVYLFAPKPSPVLRFVRDVPNDQGRAVRVRWRSDLRERAFSPADTMPFITSYTLYRRVGAGQALAMRVPAVLEATAPLPPGDWDVLTTVPATLDTAYQTVVPTLCDSTDAGVCWSTFVVRAITDQIGTFHHSAADSGYSVDNIAPGVPAGLTLQAVAGGTTLTWQPSTAADFGHFRVYRSTDPGFVPGPGTLVHATTETSWTDLTTGAVTYKVTAVDANGNESGPAVGNGTTGVESPAPVALGFAALSPNPFRHSLSLVIEVPEYCGAVDLSVFDVAGRRMRTLASGSLPAGRHSFQWDGIGQDGTRAGAGVYVARLAGAGRSLTRRVTLLP